MGRINSLYTLKAIAAFGVVCIHTPFWGKEIVAPFLQSCVPLFFAISGYLMWRPDIEEFYGKAKTTIKRIFTILLKAQIIYLAFFMGIVALEDKGSRGGYYESLYTYLDLENWSLWRVLWIGDEIGFHLWYLVAYLQVLILIWLMGRVHVKEKTLSIFFVLSISLLLIHLILGKYGYLVGIQPGDHNLRGLLISLPCFAIGVCVKRYYPFWENVISEKWNICLLVCVSLLCFVEYALLQQYNPGHADYGYLYVNSPFLSFLLLLFFVRKPQFTFKTLETIGKIYSLNIYIYHVMVYVIVSFCLSAVGLLFIFEMIGCIVTFVSTILFLRMANYTQTKFITGKNELI